VTARPPNCAVAALADAASEIRDVRRAAYAHDIGELAAPVSTWMRAGALTERETDAARLHPYHGERALTSLGGDGKAVSALVLRHHERLDGSGYHRYAKAPDLSAAPASSQRPKRFRPRGRLGGLQINDEVELGRLLDRDIGRFRTPQYPVDKLCGTVELVRKVVG